MIKISPEQISNACGKKYIILSLCVLLDICLELSFYSSHRHFLMQYYAWKLPNDDTTVVTSYAKQS